MSARRQPPAPPGTVYLVHLKRPYHHARHYLGRTVDLVRRLAEHPSGNGSPLLRAASAAGITFEIAHTWPGDRLLERQLHRRKNSPARLCPVCASKRR